MLQVPKTRSSADRLSGKLTPASKKGLSTGCKFTCPKIKKQTPQLIGESCDIKILINEQSCGALVDTGSMTSTISYSLCKQLGLSIQQLEQLLQVEAAGGYIVPYLGYVEAVLQVPTAGFTCKVPLLVVEDTQYNSRVPVVVGTNILEYMFEGMSEQVQRQLPATLLLAAQCLQASFVLPVKTTKSVTIPVDIVGQTKCSVFV